MAYKVKSLFTNTRIINSILVILIASLLAYLIKYTNSQYKEGLTGSTTMCSERKCNNCTADGYDSNGAKCYWCKNSNTCVDPDLDPDKNYNSTCTSGSHACII